MSTPTITIPLSIFLDSHLGRGIDINGERTFQWSHRPIDNNIAHLIVAITNNQHTCYVQWADEMSPHLTQPLLWDFAFWHKECDSWLRMRERERLRTIEWKIKEANIKIATRQVMEFACLDQETATKCVRMIIERGGNWMNKLKAMGVEKLVTREDELR